jgi:hypothetical protein
MMDSRHVIIMDMREGEPIGQQQLRPNLQLACAASPNDDSIPSDGFAHVGTQPPGRIVSTISTIIGGKSIQYCVDCRW